MIGGLHSATEYQFDEEQADAIVRATAYHREDFFRSAIHIPSYILENAESIATSFPRMSYTGLGSLNRIPLELLQDVLLRLDMRSLARFRQTNLRSRQTVDSLREYQVVTSHGMNLICALGRTGYAPFVSLSECYYALCTKECVSCGEFSGFISFLNWHRCCFKCLKVAPEAQVKTLAAIRKQFGMTKGRSRQLRSFRTLPGIYSMEESVYETRVRIASVYQAMLITGRMSDAPPPPNPVRDQKFNFMGACELPYYDKRTGKAERGLSCAGCQLALEEGLFGTSIGNWVSEVRDKLYLRREFLEHFRRCKQAQRLWISSGEGARRAPELPDFALMGGSCKALRA